MTASRDQDLVAYVRPLQGTDSHFNLSYGNCLPLISRPFGMTNWCPQTDEGRWLFGYRAPKLQGIRATHQPSPWIADYGHFTIMPQTGRLLLDAGQRSSLVRRDGLEIGLAENGGDPTQDGCFFEVDQIHSMVEELRANGLIKESYEPSTQSHGDTSWDVFFVVAPDGLCYCFGQRRQ